MANIQTEDITFPSNGGTASGFLARPDDAAKHPGVIVIQEWWGLNDQIKGVARRFAENGFVALAPDLYHGKVVLMGEPNEAQKAMMLLDQSQVAKDLTGAVAVLKAYASVEPKKIGVMGYCMGGYITLEYAAGGNPDLGAAVSYYGGGYDPTPEKVSAIQVPVLTIYAGNDHSTPQEMRDRFRQLLTDQGKTFDMVVYENTDHAFSNEMRPEVYDAAATDDAWQRTVAWFTTYLR